MRALKEKGLEELANLRNRVGRQYGLGRIEQEDHDHLKDLLNKVEDRIRSMNEKED